MPSTPPIHSTEVVFRQLRSAVVVAAESPDDPNRFYSEFLPSSGDSDGLSMLRAAYRTPVWCAYRKAKPDERYRLFRFTFGELELAAVGWSLTAKVDPDDLDDEFGEPFAHFVLPEVNKPDYKNNPEARARIKTWARQVLRLISAASMVPPPSTAPVRGTDPHRP